MGHYWSEMGIDEPARNPAPLESMGFERVSAYDCYNQYFHRPCLQVFYITRRTKLPDAIYYHANHCTMED